MARRELQALGAAVAMMMASWAGAANAPQLAALAKLEKGEWELRLRDDPSAPPRRLCVTMPQQLLEPSNAGAGCKPFVVSDAPSAATVTFDCGPAGNARTDLRVETPRLIQIRSQGIRGGAPFSNMVEGRHVGACN